MLDVYDGDQHRVVRLSGEEKIAGRASASADDQALRRIARAGMDQLAAFLATSRTPVERRAVAAPPPRTAARLARRLDPGGVGHFPHFRPRAVASGRRGPSPSAGGRRPAAARAASRPSTAWPSSPAIAPKAAAERRGSHAGAPARTGGILGTSSAPAPSHIASLAASLLSGRRGRAEPIKHLARRQRCGPIMEQSSSSPATPIPRSPMPSPPISRRR